jgi:hypothetical protein
VRMVILEEDDGVVQKELPTAQCSYHLSEGPALFTSNPT